MTDHDALHEAIRQSKGDVTPMHALADYMEENGIPGAHLLRSAAEFHQKNGGPGVTGVRGAGWLGRDIPGHLGSTRAISLPNGGPRLYMSRQIIWPFTSDKAPAMLLIHHRTDKWRSPPISFVYHVPVYSKQHLNDLTSDWPDRLAVEKQDLQARLKPYLPDTHEPQQMKRMARAFRLAVRKLEGAK